jgi:predicted DNA-binding transcriptional regulator YafY
MVGKNTLPLEIRAVTADRVARLYPLLAILSNRASGRMALLRQMRMNQRGFYRDIEFLRSLGIEVITADSRYSLEMDFEDALARLPFPDPHLKLGQAIVLARGKTPAHKALRKRVQEITEPPKPNRKK